MALADYLFGLVLVGISITVLSAFYHYPPAFAAVHRGLVLDPTYSVSYCVGISISELNSLHYF